MPPLTKEPIMRVLLFTLILSTACASAGSLWDDKTNHGLGALIRWSETALIDAVRNNGQCRPETKQICVALREYDDAIKKREAARERLANALNRRDERAAAKANARVDENWRAFDVARFKLMRLIMSDFCDDSILCDR